jgi:hypothetical protein
MSLILIFLGAETLKWNHVFFGVIDLLSETAYNRYYNI